MSVARLSPETKQAILDAYIAGEKIAVIGATYGVDDSYPRILYRRHGNKLKPRFMTPASAPEVKPK